MRKEGEEKMYRRKKRKARDKSQPSVCIAVRKDVPCGITDLKTKGNIVGI